MRRIAGIAATSTIASAAGASVLVVALASCIQQAGTGVDDGTDAQASTAVSGGDDGGTAAGGGTGCTEDPTTQVTLCSAIDECPGLTVDPSALAGCGFRLHAGAVIDLECLCGSDLCPIGVPDTCAEATGLLGSVSSLVVCEEASENRCVSFAQPEAGAATSTGTSSSCDPDCITSCGAAPDCQLLCGC